MRAELSSHQPSLSNYLHLHSPDNPALTTHYKLILSVLPFSYLRSPHQVGAALRLLFCLRHRHHSVRTCQVCYYRESVCLCLCQFDFLLTCMSSSHTGQARECSPVLGVAGAQGWDGGLVLLYFQTCCRPSFSKCFDDTFYIHFLERTETLTLHT